MGDEARRRRDEDLRREEEEGSGGRIPPDRARLPDDQQKDLEQPMRNPAGAPQPTADTGEAPGGSLGGAAKADRVGTAGQPGGSPENVAPQTHEEQGEHAARISGRGAGGEPAEAEDEGEGGEPDER